MKFQSIIFILLILLFSSNVASAADFWAEDPNTVAGLPTTGSYIQPVYFGTGNWECAVYGDAPISYLKEWHGWEDGDEYPAWLLDGQPASGLPTQTDAVRCWHDDFAYNAWWQELLMCGNSAGTFEGYYRSYGVWYTSAPLYAGLGDVGDNSHPTMFLCNGYKHLIAGNATGQFTGYHLSGTTPWVSNTTIVTGLGDVGDDAKPTAFVYKDELYLISGNGASDIYGFKWNQSTTTWDSCPTIITGLNAVDHFAPCMYMRTAPNPAVKPLDEQLYLMSGGTSGGFRGYVHDEIELLTPTNATTLTYDYPPAFHEINFTYTDLEDANYLLEVSRDDGFIEDAVYEFVTTNYSTHALEKDQYWWRVTRYFPATGTYGAVSNVSEFDIYENVPDIGVGIQGVIYTDDNEPLSGALVTIGNSSYSNSYTTGANGYYAFSNLANDTYSVQATKDLYSNSVIYYITLNGSNVTRNIYMSELVGEYDWRHYVKFMVVNEFGIGISGTTIAIHENAAVVATKTAITGTDGSATFDMYRNIMYTIVVSNDNPSIYRVYTLYPVENSYIFDNFVTGVEGDEHNVSHTLTKNSSSVNFTWYDYDETMNFVQMNITNSTGCVFDSNSSNYSGNMSFLIGNTSDEHCVNITISYQDGTQLNYVQCYMPEGYIFEDIGLSTKTKQIISMFFVVILAGMFTRRSAPVGAIMVALGLAGFYTIGWLPISNAILLLAFIIAFGALIRPRGG